MIFTAKGYGPAALKITPKKSIVLEETVVMRKGGVVHAEVQSTTELSTEDIEFRLPFESTWLSFPASGLKRDRAGRFILDRVGEGSMRLHCSCFGNKKQANLSVYRETPALAQFYFHPPILVKGQVRSGNRSLANVRVELSTRIIDEETGRNKTLQFSSRTDTQGKYSQEVTCPAQYEIALYSEHDLELAIHGATDAYIYDGPYLLDLQASLYRLEGFLKDFQTHEPIAGASVTFKSYVTYITQTDQDGHFIFPSLPKYNGALHISAPGYYQEPKINISPYIQGEGIALKVDLGEQGASLRLVLPKIWWVNLVETYKYDFHISSLRKLSLSDFQMQEDRWTWLIHGLPPGKRKITTNISHLKGINLEVELKEGETTELIIPSKQQ